MGLVIANNSTLNLRLGSSKIEFHEVSGFVKIEEDEHSI